MVDRLDITCEQESGKVLFMLSVPADSAFSVESISVVDRSSDRPVWWLVSDNFRDDTWQVEHVSENLSAEDVEAVRDRGRNDIDRGRQVRIIEYGVVPTGFVQADPEEGSPNALVPGRIYDIIVAGSLHGSLTLTAK